MRPNTVEHQRLAESESRLADWKHWGPYVSERAWGTVREDYSGDGDAWRFFPHDHAAHRAYRWNEDGLGAFCNRFQNVCLGFAVWNGLDPILKERLFGLSGPEGNHGEDVKEYYWYLDGTPTHSYMRMLYRYPQVEFPYAKLVEINRQRSRHEGEAELVDLIPEAFFENRFFDITVEYAKASPEDVICRLTIVNQAAEPAGLHVLPQLWFRNTWSWGHSDERPRVAYHSANTAIADERHLGRRYWYVQAEGAQPRWLFTENDTDNERLFGQPNRSPYVKGAFHEAIVQGNAAAVNPAQYGTKAAAHFERLLLPGEAWHVWFRWSPAALERPWDDAPTVLQARLHEADEFYASVQKPALTRDERLVQRQALAGLLWNKQFYHYSVELWLDGDPGSPPPPPGHRQIRNQQWRHLYNLDVVSMPDKWEYPWYASWDTAFHTLPLALIDPEWAKRQLKLMLREWYMHPNGQIPAYEWNFGDVNPPVHAWACWRVYKIDRNQTGQADRAFLQEVFHKLLLNFTWWVNRKDTREKNVFSGGFLGLDNIGLFDRSKPMIGDGWVEQADGTAWMGMYCLNMLAIALELAQFDDAYEPIATKFFEHFIYIADAINNEDPQIGLWDETDGFYYDRLHLPNDEIVPLRVRSFVGLIPLFAVETIEPEALERLPAFKQRMAWFLRYRPGLVSHVASLNQPGEDGRLMLALVDRHKLERILPRLSDPSQFLSDFGLRSMSRQLLHEPYMMEFAGQSAEVRYEPAESTSGLFGGNSNWRGPIWFPVNFLMIEALQKYHRYYGDTVQTEHPRYTGKQCSLAEVAHDLSRRLCNLFLRSGNGHGRRPALVERQAMPDDPLWRDHIWFHEYFNGDTGAGLGASHQTGWTALVAKLLQQCGGQQSAGDCETNG